MIIYLKRMIVLGLVLLVVGAGIVGAVKLFMPSPSINEQPPSSTAPPAGEQPEDLTATLPAGDQFFAEYRMERERMRGKQVEMLKEIINNVDAEREARQAASLRLVEISTHMEREMKAENLIKSKGFADCVILIQEENTTVVVAGANLRLDQEKEIIELVSRAAQAREDQITIITREPEQT